MAKLKFSVKNAQLQKIFKQDEKGESSESPGSTPAESSSAPSTPSHAEPSHVEAEAAAKTSKRASSPKKSAKSSSESEAAAHHEADAAPKAKETHHEAPPAAAPVHAEKIHAEPARPEPQDRAKHEETKPSKVAPSAPAENRTHTPRPATPSFQQQPRRSYDQPGSRSQERHPQSYRPASSPRPTGSSNFSAGQPGSQFDHPARKPYPPREANDQQPPSSYRPVGGAPRRFGDTGSAPSDRPPQQRRFGDTGGSDRPPQQRRFGDTNGPSGGSDYRPPRRFGDTGSAPSDRPPRRFGDTGGAPGNSDRPPRRFGDTGGPSGGSDYRPPRRFGDTGGPGAPGASGSQPFGQRRPYTPGTDRPAFGGDRSGPPSDRYSSPRPAGSGYGGPRPAGSGYGGPRPAGGGYGGPRPGGFGGPRPGGFGGPRPGGFGGPRPGGFSSGGPSMLPPTAGRGEGRRIGVPDGKPKRDSGDRDWKEQKQARSLFDSKQRHGFDADQEQETWIKRKNARRSDSSANDPTFLRPKELSVAIPITVKDLALQMKIKASEIISKMMAHQMVVTINDTIDDPVLAQLIGEELGCKIQIDLTAAKRLRVVDTTLDEEFKATPSADLTLRPPVVTVMGHVDHGKTSLIDNIRSSNRVASEAGAITQHMGAFRCETAHGAITFIDTPGHAAFIEIRSRGAKITDIVVLVVAGDEGIMPQTDESIRIAREAGVPIVVAVNKCDKPAFDMEKIHRQLAERDLLPEAWGGQVITVRCSALTGEGVKELLEMLALQSEVLELKANPNTRARGTVLESEISKGLGTCVTLLIQNGTLHKGEPLIFERVYGRVKTIQDEHGTHFTSAGPGSAVLVTGISGEETPIPGSEFVVAPNEKEARKAVEQRLETMAKESASKSKKISYQQIFERHTELQKKKVLTIIIKADVQGSIEGIKHSLNEIPQNKIELNIIDASLGEISESDIERAANSSAIIVGFHVNVESHADSLIRDHHVSVKTYDVIYRLVDDVKALMLTMLDKIKEEVERGMAVIKTIFRSSQQGKIAGCSVTEGSIARACHIKVVRAEETIWEGSLSSLKRGHDDVREITKGHECGIVFAGFQDFEVEDKIKFFDVVYKAQEL